MLLDHGHVITVLTDREVPLEMLAISLRSIWLCYSASAFGLWFFASASAFAFGCGFSCGYGGLALQVWALLWLLLWLGG